MRKRLQTTLLLLVALAWAAAPALAQVGGPYTADDNTVLLLHFDGDATDASSSGLNGDLAPPRSGGQDYFNNYDGPLAGFGQAIYLDNDATGNSEHVRFSDSGDSPLDLSGSWTVEAWARITPYSDDNAPRVVHKQIFALSNECANYLIQARLGSNLSGDARAAFNGAGDGCNDQNLDTEDDVLQTDTWYHYAYIRDASRDSHYVVVRDTDLNVVASAAEPFAKGAIGQPGNAPDGDSLYIGTTPAMAEERLQGFIDELRISDVVRIDLLPPGVIEAGTIVSVTPGDNEALYTPPNSAFTVEADVYGSASEISSVTLHWRTGTTGTFNNTPMSDGDGDGIYTASIPGQSEGTSAQYYVSTENTDATSFLDPEDAGTAGFLDYYGIGFSNGPADGLVLHLDFEEGTDGATVTDPQDRSGYGHGFEVFGSPVYSSDAAQGHTSLQLDGVDDYIAVGATAPFLASEEFTLDFKFSMDAVDGVDRLVVKQGGNGVTSELFHINYKVFPLGGTMRGAYWQNGGGLNGGDLDPGHAPATDTWYRAILHAAPDTSFFELRDASGDVVAAAGYSSAALPATATRGPFFIGWSQEPDNDSLKHVEGRIDDVKLYNYAALNAGDASVATAETGVVFSNTTDIMAQVDFTTPSATDGTLGVTRYAAAPSNTGMEGTATSDDGTVIDPENLSSVQHWVVDAAGLSGYTAEVCFSVENEIGIGDTSRLVLVRRETSEDAWQAQNTTTTDIGGDTYLCAAGQTGFSEFAVAGGSDNALPVELTAFRTVTEGPDVLLSWETASETGNAGFEVQRRIEDGSWQQVAHVQGAGTTTEAQRYDARVEGLEPGRHVFRLRQVDLDGASSYSQTVEAIVGMQERFTLAPVAPNPVRSSATVRFAVREAQDVRVVVYDVLGRQVRTLYDGTPPASEQQRVALDVQDLPSGLYIMRLMGEHFATSRTLTVVK